MEDRAHHRDVPLDRPTGSVSSMRPTSIYSSLTMARVAKLRPVQLDAPTFVAMCSDFDKEGRANHMGATVDCRNGMPLR